jgi:GntP family gluconate:H+ symporter
MTAHDVRLLLDATAGILLIVVLITAVRLHAFLALTIGSILVGLLAGHGATKTVLSFEAGVGGTLGYVGVIVALGTMLGKLLADSGGADMIAQTVLRHSGIRRVPWAMAAHRHGRRHSPVLRDRPGAAAAHHLHDGSPPGWRPG